MPFKTKALASTEQSLSRKQRQGLVATTEQNAETGYFSDIEFTASESNGSLLLNVVGSGAGLITDFKYRVNQVNSLYL